MRSERLLVDSSLPDPFSGLLMTYKLPGALDGMIKLLLIPSWSSAPFYGKGTDQRRVVPSLAPEWEEAWSKLKLTAVI